MSLKVFGQKRILIGFIVGIVCVVLISASTFAATQSYQNTINGLNRDKAIQSTTSSLLLELDDAETGQRGYIITGNSSYLQPYESALQSINATDSSLKNLVTGDPTLSSEYVQLQPLITEKLNELNYTIQVRNQQGLAAAQAVVNTNEGELYMDEIRSVAANMSSYADGLQSKAQASANQLATQRLDGVYFFALFGVGIIAYSLYAVRLELVNEQAAVVRETKHRKRAELLQDILAHDLRNYNQITKMTAELLGEQVAGDPYTKKLVDNLLASIDSSTQLVKEAQKIGKVLSEENVKLYPVDLMKTIEDSLTLVKNANLSEGKTISDQRRIGLGAESLNHNDARVLADNLLDSVFENIYSNAVKYSDSDSVWIETAIEEEAPYWKISISDRGEGIDDARKNGIFTRYLDSRKGSGLGLSIAHSLVVGRYGGRIEIKNRIPDDYTKGTTVEIWLKNAPSAPTQPEEEYVSHEIATRTRISTVESQIETLRNSTKQLLLAKRFFQHNIEQSHVVH